MGDHLLTSGGGTGDAHCPSQPPTTEGAELHFREVCVDASGKRILWDISGRAIPGQMLALMGPSGSGKTTLLNALSGNTPLASGRVQMDSVTMSKKLKRKISYVQQADIFFPNLTLRETLRFSALIRLPVELSFRRKLAKVEEIIATLHLQDCADTCIGNAEVRGLSGGEKKRANIGCELLTDPSLILLDEPTSGLDSTSAVQLLELLRDQLAVKEKKTIIMSIHQPSSQMYYMFEKLLLLAKGKVAYFGPICDAMTYFSSIGLHCDLQYNPADYMMDLVSDENSRKMLIGEDPRQDNKPKTFVSSSVLDRD